MTVQVLSQPCDCWTKAILVHAPGGDFESGLQQSHLNSTLGPLDDDYIRAHC